MPWAVLRRIDWQLKGLKWRSKGRFYLSPGIWDHYRDTLVEFVQTNKTLLPVKDNSWQETNSKQKRTPFPSKEHPSNELAEALWRLGNQEQVIWAMKNEAEVQERSIQTMKNETAVQEQIFQNLKHKAAVQEQCIQTTTDKTAAQNWYIHSMTIANKDSTFQCKILLIFSHQNTALKQV